MDGDVIPTVIAAQQLLGAAEDFIAHGGSGEHFGPRAIAPFTDGERDGKDVAGMAAEACPVIGIDGLMVVEIKGPD